MKTMVLAGAACLTLTALTAPVAATTFTYTGAIVDYAIPVAGQYTISAIGARGGSVLDQGGAGGFGAEARGTFNFAQDEVLRLLVGGAGVDNPVVSQGFEGFGGGGGGSFVVGPNALPLVVAGGGVEADSSTRPIHRISSNVGADPATTAATRSPGQTAALPRSAARLRAQAEAEAAQVVRPAPMARVALSSRLGSWP